ncbi:hypothetical protein [Devosia sediminis]|uniref:Uncharacterized protein n=1 Tax=Devosia sediminis TaxID=2798801 RepID=A0A934MKW7_9HYPH|nr:hypothetical protein [Devosia sediminis]MBJ3785598.1 hypothetical protein [Devosia sediminis]
MSAILVEALKSIIALTLSLSNHHAPSQRSIAGTTDIANAAFASDIND